MIRKDKALAKIISFVFGYPVLAPIDWFLVTWQLSSSIFEFRFWFLLGFSLIILVPLVFLRWEIKRGKIDGWDVESHRKGLWITFVGFLGLLLTSFLVFILSDSRSWHFIMLTALVLTLVMGLTRIFYKLSVHTALTTVSALLITYLFGFRFWPLFLLIPIAGWARLKLKKHSLAQVINSAFLVVLIYFIIYGLWF